MDFSALQTTSKITDGEWIYPLAEPRRSGWLEVSPHHSLYWEEYGNSQGEPVMALHGGPGAGSSPPLARFFNPDRYRIILFDQRGCGKSRPTVASAVASGGAGAALIDNTTGHLVCDINALRDHLAVTGRMHVFGGSWGSTLALVYAIRHADKVASLTLRGIFLGSKAETAYTFQGNAAVYEDAPFVLSAPGAYIAYPDEWRTFVEIIPPAQRADMMSAYKAIFDYVPATNAEREALERAARAWSSWEGAICNLIPDAADFGVTAFALGLALLELHFFTHSLFLPDDYILENVAAIAAIPTHIVHGRHDQCTPLTAASQLVTALEAIEAAPATFLLTNAGHSAFERETALALTAIMDGLSPI